MKNISPPPSNRSSGPLSIRSYHLIPLQRLIYTVGFISVVFLMAFVARGSKPVPENSLLHLNFWHSMTGEKGRHLQELVDKFNELNKGRIEVTPQFVGSYDEGLNKLRTAVIAHRPPNVMQITDVGTALMADSGAVIPLQDFINRDADFPKEQLVPAIRRYYEINGQLLALPFASSNPILFYNDDMLKKVGIDHPPKDFAELESFSEKLTDRTNKIYGITWPLHSWFLEEFMARQGADLILPANGRIAGKDGIPREANYLSQESRVFLTLWARMVKNGSFANVGRGWDPAEQNFLAGRAAMFITSTSDIFEVLKEAPFHVKTAPLPYAKDPKVGGVVVGGNALWIIKNRSTEIEKASYQFVKYMAGVDVQKKWHADTGYFPIRTDVIEKLKAEGFYDRFPAAWTAIEQMRASPEQSATQGALTPAFQLAREHIMTAIEELLAQQSDFESAMKKAKAKTDFALKREANGGNKN
jgi:sn-glycerol 3-phosphate transport system substrate-binding protein